MNVARISNEDGRFGPVVLVLVLVLGGFVQGCSGPSSRGTPEAQKHNARGAGLLEKQQYDAAIQEFELGLKIDPYYTLCMANLGIACHRRGFTDRGIKELENAIKTDPNVADSYNNIGEIYYDQHRDALAEENFKKAIDCFPGFDEPYFNLGRLYERRNELDKALDAYTTACSNNPKFVKAQVAAGLLYFRNGVDKDANDHFLLALEHDPKNPFAQYGLGKIAAKGEQWEEAVKRHKTALEILPDPEIQKSLDEVYAKCPPRVAAALVASAHEEQKTGKPDEALSDLEAAGKIDKKNMDVYVLRADILIGQAVDKKATDPVSKQKYAEAEKTIKAGLAVEPRNRDIRYMAGVLARFTGRPKDGETIFRELRREDPKKAGVHNWLAVCYYLQRQYRRAEREWKEAIALDPDNEMYKNWLKKIYETPGIRKSNELNDKGIVALGMGNLSEAYDLFKEALALDDQFAVAYANLAVVSIERDDLKYARAKAVDAIERDPDLGRAHNQLGIVNAREGKLEEAKKNFTEAAALDGRDPEPHFNLGSVYARLHRESDAVTEYETAIAINPDHFRSHHALGLYYVSKSLFDKAEAELKLAIRTGPSFIPARVDLARLFLRQKRYDQAIKALEDAHGLDDAAPEPWSGFGEAQEALGEKAKAVNAYLTAADRLRGKGRYQEEVEVCKHAVDLDPQSPRAHNDLGIALMDVGSYIDSLAELKRADDLEPDSLDHRFNMGICYGKKGDKARAAGCYRDIIKANPRLPEKKALALEFLGDLYKEGASDNPLTKREALDALHEALKLEPDPDRKRMVREKIAELEKSQ